jgi:hypothetical protein
MKYRATKSVPKLPPKILDVSEIRENIQTYEVQSKMDGLDLV